MWPPFRESNQNKVVMEMNVAPTGIWVANPESSGSKEKSKMDLGDVAEFMIRHQRLPRAPKEPMIPQLSPVKKVPCNSKKIIILLLYKLRLQEISQLHYREGLYTVFQLHCQSFHGSTQVGKGKCWTAHL